MALNIVYQTDQIAKYFAAHRTTWDSFYASERAILQQLPLHGGSSVLDIGCGCGGLGLALGDRFTVTDYTGVEINALAARTARQINPRAIVLEGDILDVSRRELAGRQFDVVVSLSCVDWNVQFDEMIEVAWRLVRPGGHFVSTFRLTLADGCCDLLRSYQFINNDGSQTGERAAYVVVNAKALAERIALLSPDEIRASGYWGRPSATAVTPFEQLCFAALSLRKSSDSPGTARTILDLPGEIAGAMSAVWSASLTV